MSRPSSDFLIVGAGVIGSSIAYHLARQGQRVVVLERGEVADSPVASWASAGGVRRQGRHPAEALLASEAIARWPTLSEELEADLHYRQGGNLLLAENDEEAAQLVHFVREQQAMGFEDVALLDRQATHEVAPALHPRVVAASYSPADGQADPPRTTRAFAAAARRLGAVYRKQTTVTRLLLSGRRVSGVETEDGPGEAGHVILAAGAWSDELAASVGLRLPIKTLALQMLLSTPAPAQVLQPVLGTLGRALSLKQLPDGAFFLGGGWPGDPSPDRRSFTTRQESITGNWQDACAVLPAVAQESIAQAWCGLEAASIDDIPFIGPVPELSGLTLALGFSGHGFAISPAVGRAVADQLAGHATPELDGLSPARIATFSQEDLEAFKTRAGHI
ncbi:MAG TPA: FAD-binding oxidoreductase [Ktedonobacteraceae bacterium]|nr:FAD-binding oxidoreductase [Ktedonobacteraceae bacterium]